MVTPASYRVGTFHELEIERGGSGAGTIVRFQLRALGVTREIHAEVTEPTPGQVLVETDLATGARTTFTVSTEEGGQESEVAIETEWEAKGLRRWLERMTGPPVLRRIYADELANLAALEGQSSSQTRGPA